MPGGFGGVLGRSSDVRPLGEDGRLLRLNASSGAAGTPASSVSKGAIRQICALHMLPSKVRNSRREHAGARKQYD